MLTNAEIKRLRSLHEKKFRDMYGEFLVEGEKMVREALDSEFEVVRVIRESEETMSRISALRSGQSFFLTFLPSWKTRGSSSTYAGTLSSS